MIQIAALLVLIAIFPAAADDLSDVRQQEHALIQALRKNDKIAILALTDKNFHIHWTQGSAVRMVTTAENRDEWLDNLARLRLDAYEAVISNVAVEKGPSAQVTLNESFTILSSQGRRMEKSFVTRDFWLKAQGVWKLGGRDCRSGPAK